MNIILPNESTALQEALDHACHRVIASKQDGVFYSFCVELIEEIFSHPLFSSYILEFNKTAEKSNQELSLSLLETYEQEWILLWKMHPRNKIVRKELLRIRRLVTRPHDQFVASQVQEIIRSFHWLRYLDSLGTEQKKVCSIFRLYRQEVLKNISMSMH